MPRKKLLASSLVVLLVGIIAAIVYTANNSMKAEQIDADQPKDTFSEKAAPSAGNENHQLVQVSNITGEVYVTKPDEEKQAVTSKTILEEGDTLTTKENAAVEVTLNGNGSMFIGENAEVLIAELTSSEEGVEITYNQSTGNLLHMGEHNDYYKVNVGTLKTKAEGTYFVTSVDPNTGDSAVFVFAGAVRVGEHEEEIMAYPAQQVVQHEGEMILKEINPDELTKLLGDDILKQLMKNKQMIDEENRLFLENLENDQELLGYLGIESLDKLLEYQQKIFGMITAIAQVFPEQGRLNESELAELMEKYNQYIHADGQINIIGVPDWEVTYGDRRREGVVKEIEQRQEREEQRKQEKQVLQEQLEELRQRQQTQQNQEQQALQDWLEELREKQRAQQDQERQRQEQQQARQDQEQERHGEQQQSPQDREQQKEQPPQEKQDDKELTPPQKEPSEEQPKEDYTAEFNNIKKQLMSFTDITIELTEDERVIELISDWQRVPHLSYTISSANEKVATGVMDGKQIILTPHDIGIITITISVKLDNLEASKQFQLQVVSRPLFGPKSITFQDENPLLNKINGEILIEKAADESNITGYSLYWVRENNEKMGKRLTNLKKTGEDLVFTLAAETKIPKGATGILAVAQNDIGESEEYAYTSIHDFANPWLKEPITDQEIPAQESRHLDISNVFMDEKGTAIISEADYSWEVSTADESIARAYYDDGLWLESYHEGTTEVTVILQAVKGDKEPVTTSFAVTVLAPPEPKPTIPATGPVSVVFTDKEPLRGKVSGDITVGRAEEEDNLDSYVLYWGNSNGERITEIATLAKTGEDIRFTFAEVTDIPENAEGILAVVQNDIGESEEYAYTPIHDFANPWLYQALEDQTVMIGERKYLAHFGIFKDADGNIITPTYDTLTIESDDSNIADAYMDGGNIIRGGGEGTTSITITLGKNSGDFEPVSYTFNVTVSPKPDQPPANGPVALTFEDNDSFADKISGFVRITPPDDVWNIDQYHVYFADADHRRIGEKIGSDEGTVFYISPGQIPENATGLIAVAANENGESESYAYIEIEDFQNPSGVYWTPGMKVEVGERKVLAYNWSELFLDPYGELIPFPNDRFDISVISINPELIQLHHEGDDIYLEGLQAGWGSISFILTDKQQQYQDAELDLWIEVLE
ncbi:FecR family protein [Gracilibacillus alcaliphilus]|uniref:FecR domain-containing protein n=1 Tax=Gracilibacillus alcaliphilus TaxID=1401441 RepID=UPI001956A45E|nr:FecR domain-containing protein [Gracilibacillus alcaliphilus]MBM7677667.1 hypothetical protein [Gracilibacillus alcaliphilus]